MQDDDDTPMRGIGPAAELLRMAKIQDVPPEFDGAALMQALRSLALRHDIAVAMQDPAVTSGDVDALVHIRTRAESLLKALDALTSENRSAARNAMAEIGGSLCQAVIKQLVAEIPGKINEVAALADGKPLWPESNTTALRELFGFRLPDVYACHFGRPCGVGLEARKDGTATECVRFMVAACAAMGLPATTAEAVARAHWRWKRDTESSDSGR